MPLNPGRAEPSGDRCSPPRPDIGRHSSGPHSPGSGRLICGRDASAHASHVQHWSQFEFSGAMPTSLSADPTELRKLGREDLARRSRECACGSRAASTARCMSSTARGVVDQSSPRLRCPTPCSPVTGPQIECWSPTLPTRAKSALSPAGVSPGSAMRSHAGCPLPCAHVGDQMSRLW